MHSALKIFSNLCHFLLASDGFSVAHYKEGTAAMEGDELSLLGSCLTNRVGMFTQSALLCFTPAYSPTELAGGASLLCRQQSSLLSGGVGLLRSSEPDQPHPGF